MSTQQIPTDGAADMDGSGTAPAKHRRKTDGGPTEDSIALSFESTHRNRFKFNATRGQWHVWNGHTWVPDDTFAVTDAVRGHCRTRGTAKLHKNAAVRGVEALCRTSRHFARASASLDHDPFLLGTPGGTVKLQTGTMTPANPDDLITRSTAVAPRVGTPKLWLQFLDQATGGDAAFVRYLQQVAGYCLTGDTREHALFFVYGDGGTGKSTFLNTLQRLLGSYTKTAPMDVFAASGFDKHPTELAMLAGARLVAANETEQGRKWAAARIKSLTGGDEITARFMRQDFFTYRPEFKLLFVGNFAPSFETVDEAMRRRFFVLPFDIKPAIKDERLMEKLAAEAPQIMNWCIEGCCDWQSNGLHAPERVVKATGVYFETQDLFKQWLEERVVRSDYKMTTSKSRALASWNAFRASAGEKPERDRDLNQRLTRHGYHEGRSDDRSHRERVWYGMEITSDVM